VWASREATPIFEEDAHLAGSAEHGRSIITLIGPEPVTLDRLTVAGGSLMS
jgi:hypothetical protein